MLNYRKIRIQKPINTVLRTALLVLLQLATSNRSRYAFLPADIRQVVYGLLYPGLLTLIHDELLKLLLVFLGEL